MKSKQLLWVKNNDFISFSSLEELVQSGENGYTFKNSDELSKQIVSWFENFPNNVQQNKISEKMRNNLCKFQKLRWEDNWNLRVKSLFENWY